MAASPPNTHAVAAIRKRLAEVSGELIAIEKRWRTLREAHRALSQTLRLFDPDADSHPVKPKRPYRRVVGGKLSLLVLDALRRSGRPMTTPEIVNALGERLTGIPAAAGRVRATLNYLARSRRSVSTDGKREAAQWTLGPTGSKRREAEGSVGLEFMTEGR
jgi:hypothetical protein